MVPVVTSFQQYASSFCSHHCINGSKTETLLLSLFLRARPVRMEITRVPLVMFGDEIACQLHGHIRNENVRLYLQVPTQQTPES